MVAPCATEVEDGERRRAHLLFVREWIKHVAEPLAQLRATTLDDSKDEVDGPAEESTSDRPISACTDPHDAAFLAAEVSPLSPSAAELASVEGQMWKLRQDLDMIKRASDMSPGAVADKEADVVTGWPGVRLGEWREGFEAKMGRHLDEGGENRDSASVVSSSSAPGKHRRSLSESFMFVPGDAPVPPFASPPGEVAASSSPGLRHSTLLREDPPSLPASVCSSSRALSANTAVLRGNRPPSSSPARSPTLHSCVTSRPREGPVAAAGDRSLATLRVRLPPFGAHWPPISTPAPYRVVHAAASAGTQHRFRQYAQEEVARLGLLESSRVAQPQPLQHVALPVQWPHLPWSGITRGGPFI